jgi:hypothetical protein
VNVSGTWSANESGCVRDDDDRERLSAFENETCSENESDGEENAAE